MTAADWWAAPCWCGKKAPTGGDFAANFPPECAVERCGNVCILKKSGHLQLPGKPQTVKERY
jgi:hypothetical protein